MNPPDSEKESSPKPSLTANDDPKANADKQGDPANDFIARVRRNPLVATLIVIGTLVIAIGSFTDAWQKIKEGIGGNSVTIYRILNQVKRYGIYRIQISGLQSEYGPRETVHFEVQCDTSGYLWIFSPFDGNPNLLFPCPSLDDCASAIAKDVHRLQVSQWRKLPQKTDPRTIQTGPAEGPDELILIVTKNNVFNEALTGLKSIRPDLSIKAVSEKATHWGAASTSWEVVR
ncbi:hypothetical protein MLD52_08640 [Puniceicoccaceae bacterium K14]|nr:hypothetical protein [Puniceicoccaceae bacterium K14]